MLSQTCVLNARRGAPPQRFGHKDKRISRPCGSYTFCTGSRDHVKLTLKWFHLVSIRYDLLKAYRTIFLGCTLGLLLSLEEIHTYMVHFKEWPREGTH